jgi:predicted Holliday junction resolvase-like endonuclease
MKTEILKFFNSQRQIFGICPKCREFIRMSDCRVFLRAIPKEDWMDSLDAEAARLELLAEKLEERRQDLQELARKKGRIAARKIVKKIDSVFTPRGLNPDDAKVLFHPIDYIVFDGMKNTEEVKRIVFLDRISPSKKHIKLQRSIERAI